LTAAAADFSAQLREILGADAVLTAAADCAPFLTDHRRLYQGAALAVALPRSVAQVSQLLALCHADNQRCAVGSNGRYGDPTAEQLYQTTVHYDRRARRRLIAGQISLLTTAVAFIFDLRHGSSEPKNIPLHGELIAEPRRIGVRLHL